MIDEKILENVICKRNELKGSIEKYGYANLRFFLSGSDDDANSLNIVCSFQKKSDLFIMNEDIEDELSKIVGVKVNFWGEGASGLNKLHLEEAKNAPLEEINKVIDYFVDVLIPSSNDKEPNESCRQNAKKLAQERSVFSKESATNFNQVFFANSNKSNEEEQKNQYKNLSPTQSSINDKKNTNYTESSIETDEEKIKRIKDTLTSNEKVLRDITQNPSLLGEVQKYFSNQGKNLFAK